MSDRPRERTINHTPREHLPAEVRALAEALKDLRFVGDPTHGKDFEATRHGTGTHDPDPDPDAFRRWARREHDRVRKHIDTLAKEISHNIYCDKATIASWERFCPQCNVRIPKRRRSAEPTERSA